MTDSETIDLKATRETLGESQETFAKRFEVDQSTYGRWEKNGLPTRGSTRALVQRVLADISRKRGTAGDPTESGTQ